MKPLFYLIMLQLFKRTRKAPVQKAQSQTPVTAKEIHEDFYAEADRLLHSTDETLKKKADRYNQLCRAGFYNASDWKDCESAAEIMIHIEAAKRFSDKYPAYKFMSETQIQKLCEKYGLLFAHISLYKGDVPQKNLDAISALSISNDDYDCIYANSYRYSKEVFKENYGADKLDVVMKGEQVFLYETSLHIGHTYKVHASLSEMSADLLSIVAAPDMMKLENTQIVSGYKIVDKDPIVFFKVAGGYLLVTAWGDEANIPEVVNEKLN